eukprot:1516681-Alexandrium_andersonii.AAC.1
MSASLVGSEMCIRDRCPREVTKSRLLFSGAPAADVPKYPARKLCTWACACLLYTSDAADDM